MEVRSSCGYDHVFKDGRTGIFTQTSSENCAVKIGSEKEVFELMKMVAPLISKQYARMREEQQQTWTVHFFLNSFWKALMCVVPQHGVFSYLVDNAALPIHFTILLVGHLPLLIYSRAITVIRLFTYSHAVAHTHKSFPSVWIANNLLPVECTGNHGCSKLQQLEENDHCDTALIVQSVLVCGEDLDIKNLHTLIA